MALGDEVLLELVIHFGSWVLIIVVLLDVWYLLMIVIVADDYWLAYQEV